MTSPAVARIAMVTLDCADPRASATFWAAALGGEVAHAQDEYAMVTGAGSSALGFGLVEGSPRRRGRTRPAPSSSTSTSPWTTSAEAERALTALGATVPEFQPGETWRVLLDPAGHPFCLTLAANW